MKQNNLTFGQGFLGIQSQAAAGNPQKVFDWNKAASIIKDKYKKHKDLIAEAGLQGDWDYTGGIIFKEGKPINDNYTYLSSNWATPKLILSWNNQEQEEIECFLIGEDKYSSDSKWDEESLKTLGIDL